MFEKFKIITFTHLTFNCTATSTFQLIIFTVLGKRTWPNPDRPFIQLGYLKRRKAKCDDNFIQLDFSSETNRNGWLYALPGKSLNSKVAQYDVCGINADT
jgi:hypothetical protein